LAMPALRIRVGHRVSTAVGLGGSRISRFCIGETSRPGADAPAPVDSVVGRIHHRTPDLRLAPSAGR
jgi:hypothetical protein